MAEPSIPPCVLVVADGDRIAELVDALSELHGVDVLVSSGGDDTIELFEARRPVVVVLTASLALGDAKSLIGTLRGMVPRGELAVVVIGDDAGPVRTALDALDLAPDRFVTRPLSAKALRFAVTGGIDAVRLVRAAPIPPRPMLPVAVGTAPRGIELSRVAMHAIRRATPNSSITAIMPLPVSEAVAAASTIAPEQLKPAAVAPEPLKPAAIGPEPSKPTAIAREPSRPIAIPQEPSKPTAIAPEPSRPTGGGAEPSQPIAIAREPSRPMVIGAEASPPASVSAEPSAPTAIGPESSRATAIAAELSTSAARAAMRARWEALADSIAESDGEELGEPDESAGAVAAGGQAPRATAPVEPAEPVVLAGRATRQTAPVEQSELRRLADLTSRPGSTPETSGPAAAAASEPARAGLRAPGAVSGTRPPSDPGEEPPPLPPPLLIKPRRRPTEPAELAESAGIADASELSGLGEPAESTPRAVPEPARPVEPARIGAARVGGMARAGELARVGSSTRAIDSMRLAEFVRSVDSARAVESVRPIDTARPADPVREASVGPIEPAPSADGRAQSAPGAATAMAEVPGSGSAVPEALAPPERPTPVGYPDPLDAGELFDAERGDAPAPPREPTLILREREPAVPVTARTRTGDGRVVVAARTSSHEVWSEPTPIAALSDRDHAPDLESRPTPPRDVLDFDDLDTGTREPSRNHHPEELDDLPDVQIDEPASSAPAPLGDDGGEAPEPRDFARELRAKMSLMAQRLFQGSDAASAVPSDLGPRHDHHTEIDLAALGSDLPFGVVGELEPRAPQRSEGREIAMSPGSWDTQVRERGLPDTGALVRGVSDAAMLLARMFAQGATGRVTFRRDDVETIVFFDRGRPVFASSNEPRDRMGELLLREGKITASQYERCQNVVAESGRRMGEILVDFGYLKRRELLPAVRRHVEDIIYSLFAWERGTYAIRQDAEPCAERIRLSRHAASLILEGIRRKLDRTTLERLIGPTSTVIEVRDRERLGGIVHLGDLAAEERAALAAFDGQADLAHVASTAGVDIADVLPLAWGLCVLGLAIARRSDAELPDESPALVGETDLAIDRERVRARWQLVGEADYFALLGVRRDATGFEIRRAYQSARRDFAADVFPGDLRRELARELDDIAHVLDEAFRVLRDDRLRRTYLANLIDP